MTFKKNNPGCNCCEPEEPESTSSSSPSSDDPSSQSSLSQSSASSTSNSSSTNDICQACSFDHSWLVDLSTWDAMADETATVSGDCAECPTIPAVYEVEPVVYGATICGWEYVNSDFCDMLSALEPTCSPGTFRIDLDCDENCKPTITIRLFGAFGCPGPGLQYYQEATYEGSDGDMAIGGSGVAVLTKISGDFDGQGIPGRLSPCTPITPPATITITRL